MIAESEEMVENLRDTENITLASELCELLLSMRANIDHVWWNSISELIR